MTPIASRFALAAGVALVLAVPASAQNAAPAPAALGPYSPAMMGYGYGMGPYIMDPRRMMGYGMGPYGMSLCGTMGRYWSRGQDLNLSADQVRTYFRNSLAYQNNRRRKLGSVTANGNDSFTADIVTNDGNALVDRFMINPNTGVIQRDQG